MEKQNQTKQKPQKKVVAQLANGLDNMFSIKDVSTSEPDAETTQEVENVHTPEPVKKRKMFKTPPPKQTGKLIKKADSTAPPSERRTFIIEDSLMEKIYLIKYWSRCDTISEIVNDAFRLKIEEYEAKNGILYPPQQ